MNNHVMHDIETLGTAPGSVILSIGAVRFDPHLDEPGALVSFYQNIDVQSCLDVGLGVSGPTIEWWLQQDQAARDVLLRDRIPIQQALALYSFWLSEAPVRHIWSHGASFDHVLLERAYHACRIEVPWHFYALRDTRTIFSLVDADWKNLPPPWKFDQVKHNALHDAHQQALMVQFAFKRLSIARSS